MADKIALTEEQAAFIAQCETDFASRFTDEDEAYVKERDKPLGHPPIVDPWYNKQRRHFDYSRRDRRDGGDRGNRQRDFNQSRDRYGGNRYGRDRDRDDDRGRDRNNDRDRERYDNRRNERSRYDDRYNRGGRYGGGRP